MCASFLAPLFDNWREDDACIGRDRCSRVRSTMVPCPLDAGNVILGVKALQALDIRQLVRFEQLFSVVGRVVNSGLRQTPANAALPNAATGKSGKVWKSSMGTA